MEELLLVILASSTMGGLAGAILSYIIATNKAKSNIDPSVIRELQKKFNQMEESHNEESQSTQKNFQIIGQNFKNYDAIFSDWENEKNRIKGTINDIRDKVAPTLSDYENWKNQQTQIAAHMEKFEKLIDNVYANCEAKINGFQEKFTKSQQDIKNLTNTINNLSTFIKQQSEINNRLLEENKVLSKEIKNLSEGNKYLIEESKRLSEESKYLIEELKKLKNQKSINEPVQPHTWSQVPVSPPSSPQSQIKISTTSNVQPQTPSSSNEQKTQASPSTFPKTQIITPSKSQKSQEQTKKQVSIPTPDKVPPQVQPKIKSFDLPMQKEAFFTGTHEEIMQKLNSAMDISDIINFLKNSQNPKKETFIRNFEKHYSEMQRFIKKLDLNAYDDDILYEKVTEKYFKVFQGMIFNNVMVSIYRNMDNQPAFYRPFLKIVNNYLTRCGIYTRYIAPNQKITDEDYADFEPIVRAVDDPAKDDIIDEIERLPYRILYISDNGKTTYRQFMGSIFVNKYNEEKN